MQVGTSACWPIDTTYFVEGTPSTNLLYFSYLLVYLGLASLDRSTAIPGLNRDDYSKVYAPLAPIQEQERIVAEIDKQFTRLDTAGASLQLLRKKLDRYRASILKAACEGRLVPAEAEVARLQKHDYEPASRLLERILAERRATWEKEHLLKMRERGEEPRNDNWKARYPEPTHARLSDMPALPEGWTWVTIDEISALVTSGSRNWSAHYAERGAVFIRAQDIKTDRLDLSSVAFVELPKDAEGTRTRVFPLDLLITITGANVTKTALAESPPPEAYVSQHVALVRLVDSAVARYVYSWIISPSGGRKMLEAAAYGAGKPGLNLENIRELVVPLPPLAEQRRIVDDLEAKVSVARESESALRKGIVRAARLRQSILKRAFTGGLGRQEPSDEPASVLLDRIRAEREQHVVPERDVATGRRGRRGTMARNRPSIKNTIIEALTHARAPLTPEQLFSATGYQSTMIDEFYGELKAGVAGGQIEEIRAGDESVLLRVKPA
jgi:type I restriction enzyme S subunit